MKFFVKVAHGGMPEEEWEEWAKRHPKAYRRLGKIAGFVEGPEEERAERPDPGGIPRAR